MLRPLYRLPPGTRFRQPELDLTGTLLMVNECRARVRLDRPRQQVEFTGSDGSTRTFEASRSHETSWAPTVVVEALSIGPLVDEDAMATKTSATKTAGRQPDRKMGALEAAAKVLGETGTSMNAKALIEAMSTKGYWTSPGGATPHATLYSAILREIQKKGPQARFARAENGFVLAGGSTTPAKKAAAKRTMKKPSKANDVPNVPAN
jgi:hypothetical protein